MSFLRSREFYTKRQANRLVGQLFELVYPFFGLSDGTRGRVIAISPIPAVLGRGYELVVEWMLEESGAVQTAKDRPLPKRSWMSRAEMDRYMQHIEETGSSSARVSLNARKAKKGERSTRGDSERSEPD